MAVSACTKIHLPTQFSEGGRSTALRYLRSFLQDRISNYFTHISKPESSRRSCSRLSPYLAWGNLSIREVYQATVMAHKNGKFKRHFSAFLSRISWQSHFIQKFEMEPRIEFEAFNKAYLHMSQPRNHHYLEAWKKGLTGYPLVDAAMRCVCQTGYINFRMRALLVSFLTHHLFQHFTTGAPWLAQQFLDFEPGIHYAQFQMQAGVTGIHTFRVYNPVKNALEHDPDAVLSKSMYPSWPNCQPH